MTRAQALSRIAALRRRIARIDALLRDLPEERVTLEQELATLVVPPCEKRGPRKGAMHRHSRQRRVLDYVNEHGPVTWAPISAALKLDEKKVRDSLRHLAKRGWIDRIADGLYDRKIGEHNSTGDNE